MKIGLIKSFERAIHSSTKQRNVKIQFPHFLQNQVLIASDFSDTFLSRTTFHIMQKSLMIHLAEHKL
jgi:hypothetical protein